MRASTEALLSRVCKLYPCVVMSGRSRDDVASRINGMPFRHIMGNHGLEPGQNMSTFEGQTAEVRPKLQAALAHYPGVDIEDKRFSLAIHYRKSRRKRDARRAIHEVVARLPLTMRTIPGKLVINVIPEHAPHKGDALVAVRVQESVDTAIYVGDDATDEDVFELDQPGRLLSIRVGHSKRSSAAYYLRDQREVDALLRQLARLRDRGERA
jgi:trehalose 6-phosphate phosphatase